MAHLVLEQLSELGLPGPSPPPTGPSSNYGFPVGFPGPLASLAPAPLPTPGPGNEAIGAPKGGSLGEHNNGKFSGQTETG